jgi:hypothetical protein
VSVCGTWLFTFAESRARVRECVYIIRTFMEMRYANRYFISTPVMCLVFFMYSVYSHHLTCIFLHFHVALPIDVSSIDLLFHEESTHTHWHARTRTDAHAEALYNRRVPDCFLPPLHRILDVFSNQLSVLPAGIFSGLALLT